MTSRVGGADVIDQEHKPPKQIVYPTQRTMSVVKTSSMKHIPHEPVKGAVLPTLGKMSTSNQHKGAEDRLRRRKTPVSSIDQAARPKIVTSPMVDLSGRPVTVAIPAGPPAEGGRSPSSKLSDQSYDDSGLASSLQHLILSGDNQQYICASSYDDSSSSSASESFRSHRYRQQIPANSAIGVKKNDDDVSEREKQKRDDDLNLSNEVNRLKEELEVQTKVNSDLKKLLVASIGDDLHYKVDALVRTKVQLANEIGDYTRKLVEDYEDLDKLSIQADIWHSKYQASRVLVEQLTSEHDKLNISLSQVENVMRYTLQEREKLHAMLLEIQRDLTSLMASCSQSAAKIRNSKGLGPNLLDLADDIRSLVEDICRSLLGKIAQVPKSDSRHAFTPAELMMHQVLSSTKSNASKVFRNASSSPSYPRHSSLAPRFHPGARYEGFTFTCCSKCHGEIILL